MNRRSRATPTPARACAALLCSVLAAACADPPITQISVTVDQDPDFDPPLQRVELLVATADGDALEPAVASDLDQPGHGLPRSVTLVRAGQVAEPLLLTTRGFRDGQTVVEHKATVRFTEDQLWHLQIVLSPRCESVSCSPDMTCEAGECRNIQQLSSAPPDRRGEVPDAGPNGTVGPSLDAGPVTPEPRCVIERPRPGDPLFIGDDIKLEGRCVDRSGDALEEGLSWRSDVDGELATRASQTIKTAKLEPGMRSLQLCAVDRENRMGCSPGLPLLLERKPTPPEAEIIGVTQEGVEGMGPFSSARPIEFECSGIGVGLRLNWRDNFIGDFGQAKYANMSAPRVGRHRVTLSAVDKANQSVMPAPTIVFDVIEQSRFEAGQTSVIQAFARVNDTLQQSGERAIAALASDARGMVFASNTRQVYVFEGDDANASAQPALVDMDSGDATTLGDVRAILIDARDPESLIYFGTTEGVRVCRYTPGELPIAERNCSEYAQDEDPLAREAVTSIARLELENRRFLAIGTERGLWIAQDEDGTANAPMRVPGIDEPIVGVVASDTTFWFSTSSTGVYRYDPVAGSIPELTSIGAPPPPLRALAADLEGGIWLGSEDNGLRRLEPNGVWQSQWPRGEPFEGLASDRIQALAPAMGMSMSRRVQMLWVGTDRGVTRLDYRMIAFLTLDEAAGLPSDDVRAFSVLPRSDQSDLLVIGTSEGIALYDGS